MRPAHRLRKLPMKSKERSFGLPHMTGNKIMNIIVLAIIASIPFLYSGLLSSAYQDPVENVSRMKAAVVNLDAPYTATLSTGKEETFALGNELADNLTNPPEGEDVGFTWVTMTEDEARTALKDETIRAYMVVPHGFSQTAGKLGTDKAGEAKKVQLSIVTDDGVNYIAGTMARTVAATLQGELGAQAAQQYIDTVLVSMTTIHDGFTDAADGSNKLADGSSELHDGLMTLGEALESAQAGSGDLADGAAQLATGAAALADGTGTMATGSKALADGTASLSGGATALADGTSKLNSAVPGVSAGADQLKSGASKLAGGAADVATGSGALSDGVNTYTAGADQLASGLSELAAQAPALKKGATSLADGAKTLASGTASLPDSAASLVNGVAAASSGAASVSGGALQVSSGLDGLVAQCSAVVDPSAAEFCANLTALAKVQGQVASGAQAVAAGLGTSGDTAASKTLYGGLNSLNASAPALAQGAQSLADGAATLNSSLGSTKDTAADKTVLGALNSLNSGAAQLAGQSGALRSGATDLTSGAGALADGASSLSAGTSELSSKIPALTSAVGQVNGGAKDLASGADKVNNGAQSLASGSTELNSGATTLSDGAGVLAGGSKDLSDGVSQIQAGADSAVDGSAALQDGAGELADALKAGADQVPTYSDEDQSSIGQVASAIAQVTPVRENAVSNAAGGFSPMFLALSLWIGGIAMFLVMPALDRRHSSKETWWKSATRPMSIGAIVAVVQAVLAVVLVNFLVEIHAENLLGFVAIAVLSSLTFVAVNQACVAVLSYRGRFVSLILLILQITSMGGTFPVETAPKFFQELHSWLPMTWTHYAFRAMIAGEGIPNALGQAAQHLLVWLVAAIVIVFIAAKVRGSRRPLAHDNANLADTLDVDSAPFGTSGVEKPDVNAVDEVVDDLVDAAQSR